jgi:hypothetical protein
MQYRRVRRNRTLRLNYRLGLRPKQPGDPISRYPRSSVDGFWIGSQLVRGTPSWRSSSGSHPDRFKGSESAKRVLPSSGGVKKRHPASSRNPSTKLCAFCASRMTLLFGRTMVNFSSTVVFDYNRHSYLKEQTGCEKDRENHHLGRAPLNPKRSKARTDKAIPHSGMLRQSTGGTAISRTMNEDCASERVYSRQDVDQEWRTSVFPVEIHLAGFTEEALTRRITTIQHWLNEHSFEPFTFHYTFFDAGIALRIDFKFEAEALAFADQFSGIGAYLARAVGPASPGGLEKPAKVSEGRPASDS